MTFDHDEERRLGKGGASEKTDIRWSAKRTSGAPHPQAILTVLSWDPVTGAGALLGRAKVRLACGLEIDNVAVFEKELRRWAQLPAEIMRDREGSPLRDDRNRPRYRSVMRWASRDLQDQFSAAVLALLDLGDAP